MNDKPWMIDRGVVGIRPSLNINRQENGTQQYPHQLQQRSRLQQTSYFGIQHHQKQNQIHHFHHQQQKVIQHPQQHQQQSNLHQISENNKAQYRQLLNHQQAQLHDYHQIQPPSLTPTSTNPGNNANHPSYLARTQNFKSQANPKHNFESDVNSSPYPNGGQIVAGTSTVTNPPSQNQEALHQLQNNLSMVLNQQQSQQKLSKAQTGHSPSSVALQAKSHLSYLISSDNLTAPSLTEEKIGASNIDENSSKSNASKQRNNKHQLPPPQPLSLPSTLLPTSTSELFALGDDFQPLSSSENTKDLDSLHKPLSQNNNSVTGSWSEEITSQAVANDILMNNLFHAELKSSRETKRNGKHNVPKSSPSTALNASQQGSFQFPSTMDNKEMQVRDQIARQIFPRLAQKSMIRYWCLLTTHNFSHASNLCELDYSSIQQLLSAPYNVGGNLSSSSGPVKLSPSNAKTKKSPKKKSKDVASKKTQKRKSTKRKPKFPLLEKDPPIEEQISALPVITFAPSLLANIATNGPRFPPHIYSVKSGGNVIRQTMFNGHQRKRKISNTSPTSTYSGDEIPPTETFQNILKARGHDETYQIDLEGTEYDVIPSPLQLASYGSYLVLATQSSNPALVRKLLGCGLSPNPCNQFRDSILGDLVCKQGNLPIYKCFVDEFNADLRVVDGFGRTLLHHCCWANELCRPMVEDILQRDPVQIFLKDKQEKTALEYVSPEAYGAWNDFLNEVADKYWPSGCTLPQCTLPFSGRLPSGDLMDPPKSLSPQLAEGVASGKITPEEAANMKEDHRNVNGKP